MKNSVHQDGFSCFVKIFNFVRQSGQIQIGLMAVNENNTGYDENLADLYAGQP